MSLWDSYEQLPPAQRLTIIFSVTLFILWVIWALDKWMKERAGINRAQQSTTPNTAHANSSLIVQKSDDVFYVYIAYWRFVMLPVILTIMLYVLVSGFLNLYKDLPQGYWHHWDKTATLTLITFIAILLLIAFMVQLLVRGYKAVQMEIGKDYVRFRQNSARGGMLLSDKYITLKYSEIKEIDFRQAPLIGYVLDIKTTLETYHINLLLLPADKVAVYRILDQATSNWQSGSVK